MLTMQVQLQGVFRATFINLAELTTMPSFVITGASRGIGYEFLRQFSSEPGNVVIGLVRNKLATDRKISEDPTLKDRSNIHTFTVDITNYEHIQNSVSEVSKITGGSLDFLIANAGLVTPFDQFDGIGDLADQAEQITKELRDMFDVNVIGNIHLFNLFLPLIQKGEAKKIIAITSGYSDVELTRVWDVTLAPLYSASKAALNMIMAKFSAQYRKDGILFLGLAPGQVDVGHNEEATPEQAGRFGAVFGRIVPQYAPTFKGLITPTESVSLMRRVIENAAVEKGYGGDFVSQFGNKQWL
ncbi:hypothetical protein GRF29_1g2364138 [Pseudopithomyces chartarum]|uniref:Uncharacterized protein n=1 Tax=Pseudopithomyces chartarum TaxID=1892770 RepID=A0AAN6M6S3_9PLEO|nr:hypothetical protein GRF29_1g2364138 [Pseudopithomyces chartarum]